MYPVSDEVNGSMIIKGLFSKVTYRLQGKWYVKAHRCSLSEKRTNVWSRIAKIGEISY